METLRVNMDMVVGKPPKIKEPTKKDFQEAAKIILESSVKDVVYRLEAYEVEKHTCYDDICLG